MAHQHNTLRMASQVRARLVALLIGGACGLMAPCTAVLSYPIDAADSTGIGRLEVARRIEAGEHPGRRQPSGALLPTAAVDIRLAAHRDLKIPAPDAEFSRQIRALIARHRDRYSIAVLDLTDPTAPVYAEHRAEVSRNPGSVGKILVALAFFQALADVYPNDLDARWRLLRDTRIIADEFVLSDHHKVRMWDRDREKLIRRSLRPGDQGSLFEFIDWMMSPSSNSAAAAVAKEGMLLRQFKQDYPVSLSVGQQYFRETRRDDLAAALAEFIEEPVTRNKMDLSALRQGSFFTYTGKRKVPGKRSYANARELLKFLLLMEQGKLVDEFSSREIKRLLYVTERRIRYASAPALRDAAVYFKSGSLYKCKSEADFTCKKYHGNVYNYMNSVAVIEAPPTPRRLFYLVALTSNVLRRNSAVDHQTFATRLQRLLQTRHSQPDR